MWQTLSRIIVIAALTVGLGGCVVYQPAPAYYGPPPVVYGPPVYGGVVIERGWRHH